MKPVDPCYWLFSFSTKQIAAHQSKIAQSLFKAPQAEKCVQIKQCIASMVESLIQSSSRKQFQSECNQILADAFTNNKDANGNDFDDYLWISVVLFSMFMRCNFVGPFTLSDYEIIAWSQWFKHDLFKSEEQLIASKCHQWLRVDQEDIEFELKYPFLLLLSSIILQNGLLSQQNKDNISWHWWYVRVLRYHQNILSNRCPTIQNKLLSHCEIIESLFPQSFMELDEIQQQMNNDAVITLKQLLHCQFHIEYTWIAGIYWKHEIVKTQMEAAKQCLSSGFRYEMTSKLGKRTKFQTESKAQLLLMIRSSIYRFFPVSDDDEKVETDDKNTWFLPHNIPLEDDTVLDEVQWDDDDDGDERKRLHYLEYCILLFESIQSTMVNKVKGISELVVLTYLDRLNLNQTINDWCIQTLVLLQRSRTEFSNYNKQTRAIQQYEAIQRHLESIFDECRLLPSEYITLKRHYILHGISTVDNDNNKDNKLRKEKLNKAYDALSRDIAYKRLCGIYGTSLKSKSQILCELGDFYVGLGFHQSALAIYQQLKHHHKVATCLVNLDRKNEAQQMLMRQIKQIDAIMSNDDDDNKVTVCHHYSADKKPYYLCLLGDVTDEIKYYQEAWEVSNKTYARAMRTLAYYHYHKEEYKKCMECARNALSINSLFPKVWFLLGAAAMKMKPEPIYEDVIEAFSFVVSIDATDFEAWNNLGAAHLNLKHYKSALHALQQAGDLRRDNWKIWENILTCALKLKKLSKSISTLSHLLDIKRDTMSLNPNVVAALTIELTQQIQKYQLQNEDQVVAEKENKNDDDDDIQTETEEDKISKRSLVLLVKQFDALVKNILNRVAEHSFIARASHVKQSPFTKTGVKDENMYCGISDTQKAKQTQFAYDIHEIFAIYFEKSLRFEDGIETRFKQSRIVMKYFESVCKGGQEEKVKEEYLKIIHVLNQLTRLYSVKVNKEESELDIQKLQQMLTSIQLLFNRAQKLPDKLYIDLEESKKLTMELQKMEQLTYKIKNEKENKEAEKNKKQESAMSAFADWM